MLLECAVADAYGAGFEYHDEALPLNDLTRYVQHGKHAGIRPGMYTDDTQMSIAVAECIVSGDQWTPHNVVKHFLACFLRDPRDGYARRFQAFLEDPANQTPDAFLANIRPESDRSGAAMRVGPVGVVARSIATVKEMATVQAETTHKTKGGVDSACAAALMGWFLHNTVEHKRHLPAFLEAHVPGYDWKTPWRGKVGVEGIPCVHAALTAICDHDSQADMLRWIVNLRGDVDTVAAIALSAASAPLMGGPVKEDLPQQLIDGLENGPFGRDYIIELDRKLVRTTRE
jgi:ADP-ribosylglycohydrolase